MQLDRMSQIAGAYEKVRRLDEQRRSLACLRTYVNRTRHMQRVVPLEINCAGCKVVLDCPGHESLVSFIDGELRRLVESRRQIIESCSLEESCVTG
jgi:hypothetical protein